MDMSQLFASSPSVQLLSVGLLGVVLVQLKWAYVINPACRVPAMFVIVQLFRLPKTKKKSCSGISYVIITSVFSTTEKKLYVTPFLATFFPFLFFF